MRGREKLYLALNLLLLTFCSIGIAQFAAFFPLYVGELGIRQELVAPIFSVFMVASLVMAMASGPLANRYSRLRVLTFAVGCVSTGSILFGLTPDLVDGEDRRVALFIVARLIQGLGRAGVDTMIFAMLRDRFPDDQAKVLGLAVASGAFAFTIGPPVGGLLFVALGLGVPFVLAGSMPPVVLALVLLAAPAKRGTTPTAKGAQDSSAQEEEERRITLRETAAWLWTVSSFRLFFPGLATAIAMAKVSPHANASTDAHQPAAVFTTCTAAAAVSHSLTSCHSWPSMRGLLIRTCWLPQWGIFDIGVTLWLTDEFRFPLEVASLVFSSCSIAFAFASPAAGVIADKLPQTHRWRTGMICVGLVLSGISNLSNWLYLGLPSWTVFVWV